MPVSYDALRGRLEAQRERLIDQLRQLNVAGYESLGYSTHMADDASAAFDQASDLALRTNLEQMLAQVQGALERFADNRYGTCESCGQIIDPARLKALPHAPYCLDCQRRLEG
jgi:DnaK suppressor protein